MDKEFKASLLQEGTINDTLDLKAPLIGTLQLFSRSTPSAAATAAVAFAPSAGFDAAIVALVGAAFVARTD